MWKDELYGCQQQLAIEWCGSAYSLLSDAQSLENNLSWVGGVSGGDDGGGGGGGGI